MRLNTAIENEASTFEGIAVPAGTTIHCHRSNNFLQIFGFPRRLWLPKMFRGVQAIIIHDRQRLDIWERPDDRSSVDVLLNELQREVLVSLQPTKARAIVFIPVKRDPNKGPICINLSTITVDEVKFIARVLAKETAFNLKIIDG